MKSRFTLLFSLCSVFMIAQQNVVLQIDHMLGTSPFSSSVVATNNMGEDFDVSRLQYYISEVVLIHDGGQVTYVPNVWILVNAMATTIEPLGNFNINTLEAVEFGIGVNQHENHADPAQYPANHSLAPQSPSMHWGWAPGYRFVAMEGQAGNGLTQHYEVHALGDGNYFKQTIPTQGVASGGDLIVKLNGDYSQAVRDLSVSSGPIVHGETGIAEDLLVNFNWHVFTSVEGNAAVSVSEFGDTDLLAYPNPTTGNTTVTLSGLVGSGHILVIDATGRTINRTTFNGDTTWDVALAEAGVYQLRVMQQGKVLSIRTLVKL